MSQENREENIEMPHSSNDNFKENVQMAQVEIEEVEIDDRHKPVYQKSIQRSKSIQHSRSFTRVKSIQRSLSAHSSESLQRQDSNQHGNSNQSEIADRPGCENQLWQNHVQHSIPNGCYENRVDYDPHDPDVALPTFSISPPRIGRQLSHTSTYSAQDEKTPRYNCDECCIIL